MAFIARRVLARARTLLFDEESARWSLTELADNLNEALRDISLLAPRIHAETTVLPLIAGPRQTLPDTHSRIIAPNANVVGVATPYMRKAVVTAIARATLDRLVPGWEDPAVYPFASQVVHLVDAPLTEAGEFLVFPGNDGTGAIEVVAARRPTLLSDPASPTNITAWTETVDCPDEYFTALLDGVLAKAFAKDLAVPNAAARAEMHYTAFLQKIGAAPPAAPGGQ